MVNNFCVSKILFFIFRRIPYLTQIVLLGSQRVVYLLKLSKTWNDLNPFWTFFLNQDQTWIKFFNFWFFQFFSTKCQFVQKIGNKFSILKNGFNAEHKFLLFFRHFLFLKKSKTQWNNFSKIRKSKAKFNIYHIWSERKACKFR